MRLFGLIGYPLGHSFSEKFFTGKFEREGISDARYELFEIPRIEEFTDLVKSKPGLRGLNVTIPYKEAVIPFLDRLDPIAGRIGAVNVIAFTDDGQMTGYNSDYYGFRRSLENWLPERPGFRALILGTGGASKAVQTVLEDLSIPFNVVSRKPVKEELDYHEIDDLKPWNLIINTTPLGMHPNTDATPMLPYMTLTREHCLFDLVYNPAETNFLRKGIEAGALTMNGLEMLHLQAEEAWDIWNR